MPHHSILRRRSPSLHVLAACLLLCTGAVQAMAKALKYTPANPHFGGNPFNGAELMASAAAQKSIKSLPLGATVQSAISAFTTNLVSRISPGLSQYISNQLFSASGTGSNSGTVSMGSLKIDYKREGHTEIVGMTDTQTGETKTVTYSLNTFVPSRGSVCGQFFR